MFWLMSYQIGICYRHMILKKWNYCSQDDEKKVNRNCIIKHIKCFNVPLQVGKMFKDESITSVWIWIWNSVYNIQFAWLIFTTESSALRRKITLKNRNVLCKINVFFIVGLQIYWSTYVCNNMAEVNYKSCISFPLWQRSLV